VGNHRKGAFHAQWIDHNGNNAPHYALSNLDIYRFACLAPKEKNKSQSQGRKATSPHDQKVGFMHG
jgi:hypothetical protein